MGNTPSNSIIGASSPVAKNHTQNFLGPKSNETRKQAQGGQHNHLTPNQQVFTEDHKRAWQQQMNSFQQNPAITSGDIVNHEETRVRKIREAMPEDSQSASFSQEVNTEREVPTQVDYNWLYWKIWVPHLKRNPNAMNKETVTLVAPIITDENYKKYTWYDIDTKEKISETIGRLFTKKSDNESTISLTLRFIRTTLIKQAEGFASRHNLPTNYYPASSEESHSQEEKLRNRRYLNNRRKDSSSFVSEESTDF